MILRLLSLTFFLLLVDALYANDLRKVRRALEKGETDKAIELLISSIRQIEINPGAKWVLADIYSTDSLNYYDLDSAYFSIQAALVDYSNADEAVKQELEKQNVYLEDLESTFRKIEKLSFELVKNAEDTTSHVVFISRFPSSMYVVKSQRMLDSLRFIPVNESSDWKEYKHYIDLYPASFFLHSATEKYESLYFKYIMGNEPYWLNYVKEDHPQIFKAKIFENLYKKISVLDDPVIWEKSLQTIPSNNNTKRMIDRLYMSDKSRLAHIWEFLPEKLKDSLIYVANESEKLITAWPDKDGFGFIDTNGNWQINPSFDSLLYPREFNFSKFKWIVGWKNGKILIVTPGSDIFPVNELKNFKKLDEGLYLWEDELRRLMLENGEFITSQIDTAEWLENRWIKVKKGLFWGLLSTSGDVLAPFEYESIEKEGNFWVFKRQNKFAVTNLNEIAKELGEGGFTLTFRFTDYELINDSLLLGYNEEQEALLNSDLYFYIPWGEYEIYPSYPFHYARKDHQYLIFDNHWKEKLGGDHFSSLIQSPQWVAVRDSTKWSAFQNQKAIIADSMYLITSFALIVQDSSGRRLEYSNGFSIQLPERLVIQRLVSEDEEFIQIQIDQNKSLWDKDGHLILQGPYEKIEIISSKLFKVQYGKKFGLIDHRGFRLLDFEYDFIQKEGNLIQLLNQGKIGIFDPQNQIILPESYEEGFLKFNNFYLTRKNGKYGMVDASNQIIVPFEFQKIIPIEYGGAWVMTDSTWAIFSWDSKILPLSGILRWHEVGKNTYELLLKTGFGLYDFSSGWIVPPVFTSCRKFSTYPTQWIGEFYFSESDFYIITTYSIQGNKLWSASFPGYLYEQIMSY